MTKIIFCDCRIIKDYEIGKYLQMLPSFMHNDVSRYKFSNDQKSRLIARLILCHCMKSSGRYHIIDKWKRDEHNKPFIEGWDFFSIAHAGDLVIFSHGKNNLGIDTEKNEEIGYRELTDLFHPAEQDFIDGSADSKRSFYEIWVKKEALLKAIGTGITNGLSRFNCVEEEICDGHGYWHFHPLAIKKGYTSYLCCTDKEARYDIEEFSLATMNS